MELLRKGPLASAKTIFIAGLLFFSVVFLSSFIHAVSQFGSAVNFLAAAVATLAVTLFVAHLSDRYCSRRTFLFLLIAAALLVRIIWIVWIQTPPASDFLFLHNAALQAASGDFSFANDEYYASWVYQLGFTMYEALIIKLFGSSLFILTLLNVFFSVGTTAIVYFAASKIFNDFCGKMASLFYAFYVPNIIMCSVLTNQHFSTFLFMCGCLLLLGGWHGKYRWIYIGVLFGIGNLIRPLGMIILIGMVFFSLLLLWQAADKKPARSVLAGMAGVIAVFYIVQAVVSYSFIYAGVTKYPLGNREPNWKFMVGLNAKTNGAWSMEDAKYVLQYNLGKQRNQAEWTAVEERLADKKQLAALFARKLVIFWGSQDASASWSLQDMNRPELADMLSKLERAMYVVMSAFGVLSLLTLVKARNADGSLLFVILILAYAAVHLLIEIQTRYRLDVLPAFIILQSFGIFTVYEQIRRFTAVRHHEKGVPM